MEGAPAPVRASWGQAGLAPCRQQRRRISAVRFQPRLREFVRGCLRSWDDFLPDLEVCLVSAAVDCVSGAHHAVVAAEVGAKSVELDDGVRANAGIANCGAGAGQPLVELLAQLTKNDQC